MSGSFAELRSNHFHSGIDIKTQGTTGIPVYAVAGGTVARIVVSPSGFGKALYINHPNGTTSVYGHLKNFRNDIEQYVKNIQYARKSFRIDVQVPETTFPVKQGDFIASSGNRGSSGGPHLHFEIRDTRSQDPLNPLKYDFPVKDRTPPKIFSLMVVPLDEHSHVDFSNQKKSYPVVFYEGEYHLRSNPVIPVFGTLGLAIRANDYFDESYNRCGIYSLQMKFDGEPRISWKMDRFSFSESRFINSHIDYATFIETGKRYQKTWVDPGNRLRIYDYVRENGHLEVYDGNIHIVRFELKDTHGNTSVLQFKIRSKPAYIPPSSSEFIRILKHGRENQFRSGGLKIDFPPDAFYADIPFTYKRLPSLKELRSPIHVIHQTTVPLHERAVLSIKSDSLEAKYRSKALLVSIDTLTERLSPAGGTFRNGWVTGRIRQFGNYAVAIDTVPPEISPLSIKNRAALTESRRIRFRIKDKLSGIAEIEGQLDGKWALFEYDAKNHLITHYFDPQRFELKKRHRFKLTVTDHCENKATYEASFWK